MSSSQPRHNTKIEGGFLGLLAELAARALPLIARNVLPALGVGALSGLASSGVQKAMGSGLYLKNTAFYHSRFPKRKNRRTR